MVRKIFCLQDWLKFGKYNYIKEKIKTVALMKYNILNNVVMIKG